MLHKRCTAQKSAVKKTAKLKNSLKLKSIKVFKEKIKPHCAASKLKFIITESDDKSSASHYKVIISKCRESVSVIFISHFFCCKAVNH